jgi:Domain of unknown function (DUF4390)
MLAMSNTRHGTGRSDGPLSRFRLIWLLCFFATMLVAAPARAETRVDVAGASLSLDDGVHALDADLEIELPGGARRAIEAGLPLRLTYEIEIARVRRYMLDAEVAVLEQNFELGYHALSQRYLVRNLNTGEQQDFGSLSAALDALSSVRGLPLIDASLLEEGASYAVRVRAALTLRSAPDTLSWLLFWTDDWSATSEWYEWTLRP